MSMDQPSEPQIEERSGISSVSEASEQQSFAKKGIFLLVALLIGGILIWSSWDTGEGEGEQQASQPGSIRIAQPFTPAPEPAVFVPRNTNPVVAAPEPINEEKKADNKLLEAARRAPVLAFTGRSRATPGAGTPAAQSVSLSGGLPPGLLGGETKPPAENARSLDKLLKAVTLKGTKARQIANLHMTVPKGTHIPCTLETAMSSDQPGLVSCIIARDVLGGSGQVVLMEKGSKAFGQYEGEVERGQKRMFVLWTEVRTPTGVVISLDSPATDQVGRAGFTGRIDSKFFERFGAAFLLSIVSDASAFVFQQAGEQFDVEFNATSQAPDDAVAIAVEESINIKPTLYKHQGEAVNIFVARDLDFTDIYRLQRTESLTQIYDRTIVSDIYQMPVVTK